MALLGRKFKWSDWAAVAAPAAGEVSADLVTRTAEVKTKGNTLSFWRIEGSPDDVLAATAVAVASARDRLDALDVVWLEDAALVDAGVILRPSRGETRVRDLAETHIDAADLDAFRLASVASSIMAAVQRAQFKLFTRDEVRDMLKSAVATGRVGTTELSADLRRALVDGWR